MDATSRALDARNETLTENQFARIQQYAQAHGRTWKACLREDWEKGRGELIDVRNQFGPSWLTAFHMPRVEPACEVVENAKLAALERERLARQDLATAHALLQDMNFAAKQVLANWERGDLAAAVRELDARVAETSGFLFRLGVLSDNK